MNTYAYYYKHINTQTHHYEGSGLYGGVVCTRVCVGVSVSAFELYVCVYMYLYAFIHVYMRVCA